jgi:hypothetical protein
MTTSNIQHLAIRIGRTYTLVTVDRDANQCMVETSPRLRERYGNVHARLVHEGISERSIRRAARDAAGRSYRALKALVADTDVEVTRAREYDC